MTKSILVLGGTSPAGIAFCLAALRDGHTLILYVRNFSKLPIEISSIANIVVGQLDDTAALEHAVSHAKTCVSFLGPNLWNLGKGLTPITDGYRIILPLLQKHNYTRALFISTASYHVPQDAFSILYSLMVWSVYLLFSTAYKEINGFTPLVAQLPADELAWTIFRVPVLRDGEAKPVKAGFVGEVGLGIERKALAEWVLREMEEEKWVGKCPAVSNA
jgi:nucleoside-diphosphate-sugar epimerase